MRTPRPYITFCIPSLDSGKYLHVALDSLMRFDNRIEVLVVDDGSTDNSLSIAKSYAEKYRIFRILQQERKGHGGAINAAIKEAKGQYFKVLDSDDWVDVSALSAFLRDLERAESLPDLYIMDYTYWKGHEREERTVSYENCLKEKRTLPLSEVGKMKRKQHFSIHSTIVRLSLLKEKNIQLPERCSYEDGYYVYACLNAAETIRYIHRSLDQYWVGRSGQSMSQENLFRKWKDVLSMGELVYSSHDIAPLKKDEKNRFRLLSHHLEFAIGMAMFVSRSNGSEEAEGERKAFLLRLKEKNPAQARLILQRPIMKWMNLPGKIGKSITCSLYRLPWEEIGPH